MLYPENYAYLEDLLTYVAVGARSSENQMHRLVSSGIDLPVGIKNPMSGSVPVLINSIYAFHYETVMKVIESYSKTGLENPAIIIDTNHSNSGKQYKQQIRIVEEVLNNRLYDKDFKKYVKGFMIESFIEEGCQKEDVVYGRSITDPCLGWADTERLILDIADKV